MSRPALYARVSSQRQENEHTIESQIAELRQELELAGERDWLEFLDQGYSRDDLARPCLDRLRDLVQSGDVSSVYIQAPDRLASGAKLVILFEEFTSSGTAVKFLKGDVEDTAEGRLLLHMQGAIGEYEKTKIAERTRRGKLHWARQGFLPAGIKPFGYRQEKRSDSNRGTLAVDKESAPVVRDIFRWFADEGLSLRGVAQRLTHLGVATARGGSHWSPTTISKILNNSAYKGELVYQKTERVRGGSTRKQRPESDWIVIPVPRVVTDGTWDRAQSRLQNNRYFSSRNQKQKYLLTGLVFCPRCGSRYTGAARYGKRRYRCGNTDPVVTGDSCLPGSVDAARLEQAVWESVSGALRQPELLAEEYRKRRTAMTPHKPFEEDRKQIKLALKRVAVQQDRMTEAYKAEAIDLDRYKNEMDGLQAREEQLQTEAASVDRIEREQASAESTLEHLDRFCAAVNTGLDVLEFHDRQQLLRLLVERITYSSGDVTIDALIPDDGDQDQLRTRHPEPVEG